MRQFLNITFLTFLLVCSLSLYSQNRLSGNVRGARVKSTQTFKNATDSSSICGDLIPITDTSEMPLYVIDNIPVPPTSSETIDFLEFENFADALVYQKNDSISKSFGELGRNGVIYITFKPKTRLVPLNEILVKWLSDRFDKTLNVFVNDILIRHPAKFFIDESSVSNIEIITKECQPDKGTLNKLSIFINLIAK
ncbi:MAG: hypothetical protein WBP16_13155 [Ferruginibacter sp.]